eukprot:jgi/Psemu1/4250/gm1.4250_g
MDEARNSATQHFYTPEPGQLMSSPKPIKTPYKDEDEDEREMLKDEFQCLTDSLLGTNDNEARVAEDPLAFVIQRKRARRKKLATKATKKMLPSLFKVMVKRSNKLNKTHICLKWHLTTKAQSVQELVKQIDPGYDWKIEAARDPTANPPPSPPTPEIIEEADLLNILDWLAYNISKERECKAQHKLPPNCKDNNHFKQDWDTEDMEASAAGPDIQLAQSWKNPSTISSKATWDSQSHEHPRFAKSPPPPLRAWRRSYFNN